MAIKLLRGALNLSKWALCAVGAIALLLTALVATPLTRPPEMRSVSESRNAVDFSNLPALERFQARDGTMLGFRHYPASSPATGRAAIVIHGSSRSRGTTPPPLAATPAAPRAGTWAGATPGQGAPGSRGDIAY